MKLIVMMMMVSLGVASPRILAVSTVAQKPAFTQKVSYSSVTKQGNTPVLVPSLADAFTPQTAARSGVVPLAVERDLATLGLAMPRTALATFKQWESLVTQAVDKVCNPSSTDYEKLTGTVERYLRTISSGELMVQTGKTETGGKQLAAGLHGITTLLESSLPSTSTPLEKATSALEKALIPVATSNYP